MVCNVTVYKYRRNLEGYTDSLSFMKLKEFTGEEKKFLNTHGSSANSFLNTLPIFEALGLHQPVLGKYMNSQAYKHLELYTAKEEIKALKQFNKNKNFEKLRSAKRLVECNVDKYQIQELSIVESLRDYEALRNADIPSEDLGVLSLNYYSPHTTFSIAQSELLKYLNSFYQYCSLKVGMHFVIQSFNVFIDTSMKSFDELVITVVYTYCGISYKYILRENVIKKGFEIKCYVEYNNLIEIMISVIVEQEINGRFVYFTEIDKKQLEDFYCPICLSDELQSSAAAKTFKCGHTFCEDCFLTWLKVKPRCPLCNTSFSIFSRFPKWFMYQDIFMTKYWKLKLLCKGPGMFRFLRLFVKLARQINGPLNVLTLEFLGILLIFTRDSVKKFFETHLLIPSPKEQICLLNSNLDYLCLGQGLAADCMAYLQLYFCRVPIVDRRKRFISMTIQLPEFFLGDYLFKDVIRLYGYNSITNLSEAPHYGQAYLVTSHNREDAPEQLHGSTFSGFDHSASSTFGRFISDYVVGNSRDYIVKTATELSFQMKFPFLYDKYFKNYYKSYYSLFNKWIQLTATEEESNFVFFWDRLVLHNPILFLNEAAKLEYNLRQLFAKLPINPKVSVEKVKEQNKLNRVERFKSKLINEAANIRRNSNTYSFEVFIIQLILTICDLADISIVVAKILGTEISRISDKLNVKDRLQEIINKVFELMVFNDVIFTCGLPSADRTSGVAPYLSPTNASKLHIRFDTVCSCMLIIFMTSGFVRMLFLIFCVIHLLLISLEII